MKKILSLVLFLLLLVGCSVNPYLKNYNDMKLKTLAMTDGVTSEEDEEFKLFFTEDVNEYGFNNEFILRKGYVMIGYSNFNDDWVSIDQAVEYGKDIEADAALFKSKYTHTVVSMLPVAYKKHPYAVPLKETGWKNVPFKADRYNYFVTYWVKIDKFILGAHLIKAKDGSLVISAVVEGSPADKYGLLTGMVLEKFDGDKYDSVIDFINAVKQKKGKEVTVTTKFNGIEKDFKVKLNNI